MQCSELCYRDLSIFVQFLLSFKPVRLITLPGWGETKCKERQGMNEQRCTGKHAEMSWLWHAGILQVTSTTGSLHRNPPQDPSCAQCRGHPQGMGQSSGTEWDHFRSSKSQKSLVWGRTLCKTSQTTFCKISATTSLHGDLSCPGEGQNYVLRGVPGIPASSSGLLQPCQQISGTTPRAESSAASMYWQLCPPFSGDGRYTTSISEVSMPSGLQASKLKIST